MATTTLPIARCCSTAFASAPELVREGYTVVNTNDTYLYIVPKAGNYNDYLDTKILYEQWNPAIFDLRNPAQNPANLAHPIPCGATGFLLQHPHPHPRTHPPLDAEGDETSVWR